MSGLAPKEVETLCPGRKVPGVFKGSSHPGRAVLMWDHPGMVCEVQEDTDFDDVSDMWFLLFDGEDPRR